MVGTGCRKSFKTVLISCSNDTCMTIVVLNELWDGQAWHHYLTTHSISGCDHDEEVIKQN